MVFLLIILVTGDGETEVAALGPPLCSRVLPHTTTDPQASVFGREDPGWRARRVLSLPGFAVYRHRGP